MEYTQNFENLKNEINKSEKTLEGLSGLMKNFSEIADLQDTLKNFQKNNVLSRIETKIDILAQTDSTEILKLLINELNADLSEKYSLLFKKIGLMQQTDASTPLSGDDIQDITEIKESLDLITSNFQQVLFDLNDIKASISESDQSDYKEKSGNLQNLTKRQENFFLCGISDLNIKNTENLQALNESLQLKLEELQQNLLCQDDSILQSITEKIDNVHNSISTQENALQSSISDLNLKNTENFQTLNESLQNKLEKLQQNLGDLKHDNPDEEKITKILGNLEENLKHITENLYPVHNLQTVNESMQSAQDKLNMLILNFEENNNTHSDIKNEFQTIKNELSSLDNKISGTLNSFENNATREEINELKNTLGLIKDELTSIIIKEKTDNGSDFKNITSKLNILDEKIAYITSSLYPLHNLQSINESFKSAQEKLSLVFEHLEPNNTENNIATTDFGANFVEVKNILSFLDQEIDCVKDTLNTTVQDRLNIILEKFNENNNQEILRILENKANNEDINELKNLLLQNFNENSNQEILYAIENKINEAFNSFVNNINNESITELKNILIQNIENNNSQEILCNLDNRIQEALIRLENTEPQSNIDELKNILIQNIENNNNQEILCNLDNRIQEALIRLENTEPQSNIDELKNILIQSIENNNNQEILYTLDNRIQEALSRLENTESQSDIDELKNIITQSLNENNNKDVLYAIDNKIQEVLISIENNEDNDLKNINLNINDNFSSTQDKLNILIDQVNNISPENIRNTLDFQNKFGELNFKIDSQVMDAISSVKECIYEIQDKQYQPDEIRNAISFINHSIEKLTEELKYNTTNNISEDILDNLLNDIYMIKESVKQNSSNINLEGVNEKLNDLDSKISALQEIDEFKDGINLIKNSLYQLEEKFNYTNEKISELENFTSNPQNTDDSFIAEQLQSVQEELNQKINSNNEILNEFLSIFNSKIDELKTNEDIKQLKDGIYFLSDTVRNSSETLSNVCDEVYLIQDLQNKAESINNQLRFVSKSEEVAEVNDKIDLLAREIRDYKEQLSSNNASEAYMNEIIDSLNSISHVNKKNEHHLNKTNEVLGDIKRDFSKMTDGFKDFDNDLTEINSKLNKFVISSNENTNAIKSDLKKNLASSNAVKQAMIQLAEWIDSAGKMMEDNSENIEKSLINTQKFENLELRLENIEAKLERLIDMELKEHNAC